MNDVTAEQFAESVQAAIGTVTHLYGQIDRLNAALKDALTTEPDRFSLLGGIPPAPAKGRPFRVIRYDYGGLYQVDTADGEDDIEDDELDTDVDAGDESESKRPSGALELLSDQPILAVRVLLFDAKRPEGLEPQILYAAMTDWVCGSKLTKPKAGEPFRLRRRMLLRIVRAINPRMLAAPPGERVRTKATVIGRGRGGPRDPERELSARLCAPVRSARLYDLDGSGAVEKLAADIKAYWQEHAATESEDQSTQ